MAKLNLKDLLSEQNTSSGGVKKYTREDVWAATKTHGMDFSSACGRLFDYLVAEHTGVTWPLKEERQKLVRSFKNAYEGAVMRANKPSMDWPENKKIEKQCRKFAFLQYKDCFAIATNMAAQTVAARMIEQVKDDAVGNVMVDIGNEIQDHGDDY